MLTIRLKSIYSLLSVASFLQAVVDKSVEPGKIVILPFSVVTQGDGGLYTINARNDRDFPMNFPSR